MNMIRIPSVVNVIMGVVMKRRSVDRLFALWLLAALASPALAGPALAQTAAQEPQNQPGQFDFYVLSLSWSPSFCAAAAALNPGSPAPAPECGTHAYSFIVQGLWPQYESGFPQDCQVPAPRLNRAIVSSMLDLMPSPRLVFGEWDRHGTCSGLAARNYFDTVRKARELVTIPAQYGDLQRPLDVTPGAVKDAFIQANPGLSPGDIAVSCDTERLTEVRLCLSKDLKFRACPEIVARSCQRQQVRMPPVHGNVTGAAGAGGSG
jgi:ribonuclease T2